MPQDIGVQSQVKSYQRLKKMVLDATLLNIQHYKVQIQSKVNQSKERGSVVTIEKEAFMSPTLFLHIYIYK